MENANYEMKRLSAQRAKTRRFQREITTKADDMKAKIDRRVKESRELGITMDRQWQELAKLFDVALTAKTA